MGQFDSLFDGTEEEILSADSFTGNKIEKSGIYLAKITMAKQKDSGSSNSKAFVLELETESGAKLFHDFGWYINKTGTHLDKNGKILPACSSLVYFMSLVSGVRDVPALTSANIKEYNWESKSDVTVSRMIARDLIGKIVKVQVVNTRTNKQVKSDGKTSDGYAIYVDGPEEKFTNVIKRFYDGVTGQTVGEKQLSTEAKNITKDAEYCEKTPVLDKYKAVAGNTSTGGQPQQAAGFGGQPQTAPTQGFAQPQAEQAAAPTQGFGQQ